MRFQHSEVVHWLFLKRWSMGQKRLRTTGLKQPTPLRSRLQFSGVGDICDTPKASCLSFGGLIPTRKVTCWGTFKISCNLGMVSFSTPSILCECVLAAREVPGTNFLKGCFASNGVIGDVVGRERKWKGVPTYFSRFAIKWVWSCFKLAIFWGEFPHLFC